VRGMDPGDPLRRGERPLGVRRRPSGIAQWLTVQGSGRINLNTAPREVLAALPGFTPAVVAVVLDLRQRRWIWSISDVAADPRLQGAPSLEAVARQLIRLTAQGLGTESAWVRSQAPCRGARWRLMSRPYSCTDRGRKLARGLGSRSALASHPCGACRGSR